MLGQVNYKQYSWSRKRAELVLKFIKINKFKSCCQLASWNQTDKFATQAILFMTLGWIISEFNNYMTPLAIIWTSPTVFGVQISNSNTSLRTVVLTICAYEILIFYLEHKLWLVLGEKCSIFLENKNGTNQISAIWFLDKISKFRRHKLFHNVSSWHIR